MEWCENCQEWRFFCDQYLTPNPAILPPTIVHTDEEATRITDTTPGSHVHVVKRGVVVSEYWGKPF